MGDTSIQQHAVLNMLPHVMEEKKPVLYEFLHLSSVFNLVHVCQNIFLSGYPKALSASITSGYSDTSLQKLWLPTSLIWGYAFNL